MTTPIALTIAGSDPTGGAGFQADLKAFSALGAYGATVITAVIAQNTMGVSAIRPVEPRMVRAQMDAVFEDLDVDAVKIGMLGTAPIIDAVAEGLRAWKPRWIVVDPVMVAKSGDRLLEAEAVEAMRERLLPLASIITPNLPEAADLLGTDTPDTRDRMANMAARLQALGPANVLLKGGHLTTAESPDLFLHGGELQWLESPRTATRNTHGTGCTLSAAIAAGLARRASLPEAVIDAKRYIAHAIAAADRLAVGRGNGPVHHFHALWKDGP